MKQISLLRVIGGGYLAVGKPLLRRSPPEAWGYVVSGYEVLRQWIKWRIGLPLSLEIQSQLVDVIWAVEQIMALRPVLNDFGDACLPPPPHLSRQELRLA
jgi:hypothetical protein